MSSTGKVRSVERAGKIVTVLAEHPYAMGVSELAERIGLSSTSVHRLLGTLVSMGWVEQDMRTARYRLGNRIIGIGTTGRLVSPAVQEGPRLLAQIMERTGYDGTLSSLVGMRVVMIARVAGPQTPMPDIEPGISYLAHSAADGKVLLSYVPKAEREYAYAVNGLPAYTSNTVTDVEALEAELELVRNRGYALEDAERRDDTRAIAVPVLGPDKHPMLALQMIGGLELEPEWVRAMVPYLQSLARELGERLTAVGGAGASSESRPS